MHEADAQQRACPDGQNGVEPVSYTPLDVYKRQVFAESEVITLVGEGKPMDEIAAGIEMAVAKRCFVMAKKAGATDVYKRQAQRC